MSGGSDTVVNSVPDWVRPYAEQFMQRSQQTADIPYTPYGGQTVAQLNPYQQTGLQATANRAMQGSPVTDAASGELQKTLSGDYLNANPYMSSMVDQAQGDVLRNYELQTKPALESAMVRSGSFGNSGLQQMQGESQRQLANELGRVSTNLRGTDYANERGRMQGAVGMAPAIANQDYVDASQLMGAGERLQGQEQANLSDQYSRFQEARNYPQQQLATAGRGLGFNFGNQQTGPGANPWAQGLGTGLAAYGAYNMGSSGGSGGGK